MFAKNQLRIIHMWKTILLSFGAIEKYLKKQMRASSYFSNLANDNPKNLSECYLD